MERETKDVILASIAAGILVAIIVLLTYIASSAKEDNRQKEEHGCEDRYIVTTVTLDGHKYYILNDGKTLTHSADCPCYEQVHARDTITIIKLVHEKKSIELTETP